MISIGTAVVFFCILMYVVYVWLTMPENIEEEGKGRTVFLIVGLYWMFAVEFVR